MLDSKLLRLLHHPFAIFAAGVTLIACLYMISCGGTDYCHCTPTASAAQDFRHAEKHIPLPNGTPVETTVAQILSWPAGPDPTNTTPRSGRELTLYHISLAYLENARLVTFDCDFHLELSDTPDKNAPRVIVETPIDHEYCPARTDIAAQLLLRGFGIRPVQAAQGELRHPQPVSVVGLAFRDFEHNRGSVEVGTPWELHPAKVMLQ